MNIEDIVRVGNVDSINPQNGTVRVRFPDMDDKVSKELKIIYSKTYLDKSYFMPEINEIVLCIFLPGTQEEGFVLGAFYNQEDTVPVSDPNKKAWYFSDGGIVEYDKAKGGLTINAIGKVEIKAPDVEITAGNIILNGNVKVSENLEVSGNSTLKNVEAENVDASSGVTKGGAPYIHP